MLWTEQIDAYCERLGPGLWAEPLNAVTNLAFLVAALVMWRRTGGQGLGGLLSVALALIGICSGLFHTLATVWAGAADSGAILLFVLIYLYAANRRFAGLAPWAAFAAVLAALPVLAALGWLFSQLPALGSSAGYAPVAVLILTYAAGLARRRPRAARGLAIGAGILTLSLIFRTLDMAVCASVPPGTHFLWHLLNALMLGWMIEVWRRAG